jgi:AcrR family transcriptional regulator
MTEQDPQTKGERTRKAILESTYTLVLEQGYAATSMRQIAERSGIGLGAIYNHFTGKEAIFSEMLLLKHPFHQILPLLQAAPGETIEDFVRNAAKEMVAALGNRPDFIKLLFVELVEFEGRDFPKMFQVIFPQVLPLIDRFHSKEKELRSIDPFILFRAFLGLFFSFFMTEFLLAGTPAIVGRPDALEHFVEIFLHGALAPKENL